ncbi:nitroreductase/quinone reductase family protein [Dactylosporangium sp. CA-233914]|uniref:nitroreductase/quinone reductase family protein n=1 Tax=Dactylosporangium sp. CA-233914 TaxID=3239934 RepID=UPI003D92393C
MTRTPPTVINHVYGAMVRLGLGRGDRYILTVAGRRTGRPRSTPVDVMHSGDRRWLVAPYGVTAASKPGW